MQSICCISRFSFLIKVTVYSERMIEAFDHFPQKILTPESAMVCQLFSRNETETFKFRLPNSIKLPLSGPCINFFLWNGFLDIFLKLFLKIRDRLSSC